MVEPNKTNQSNIKKIRKIIIYKISKEIKA